MQDFKNKTILVTAGPTIEDIDPVRFISNRSSGKMGVALADRAYQRGGKVVLILGPVHIQIPGYLHRIDVRSAADMYKAVRKEFQNCDIFISCAAVADYTPVRVSSQKIKKGNEKLILELSATKDILKAVGNLKTGYQKVIGFSVETENLADNSLDKLKRKNLDMIIANNPLNTGAGFAHDTNQVNIFTPENHFPLPLLSKIETADKILDHILLLEK